MEKILGAYLLAILLYFFFQKISNLITESQKSVSMNFYTIQRKRELLRHSGYFVEISNWTLKFVWVECGVSK